MTKNLIPVIAKELGVEIGEEFRLVDEGLSSVVYRFTIAGLERQFATTGEWKMSEIMLNNFLGKEITKLPFEPKDCEDYWTYNFERFSIVKTCWRGTAMDYACKFAGIVFRTGKEALIARPVKYKELTGKEWEEWEE